jgi:hypothetical protein
LTRRDYKKSVRVVALDIDEQRSCGVREPNFERQGHGFSKSYCGLGYKGKLEINGVADTDVELAQVKGNSRWSRINIVKVKLVRADGQLS